jgi:hypothetical protein
LTPGFVFLLPVHATRDAAKALVDNMFHERPLMGFSMFAVAGLALVPGRWRFDLLAMTFGSLIGGITIILVGYVFTPGPLERYYFAYVTATAIAVVITVGQRRGNLRQPMAWARDALAIAAVVHHVGASTDEMRKHLSGLVDAAARVYKDGAFGAKEWNEHERQYAELQSHMAPGARAVVAVEEAFHFDFGRNRIDSLDLIGGMGERPGFPVFKGPEALESYLRGRGVRYIAYVEFDHANELYNRPHWKTFLNWNGSYLQGEAPYLIDGEDSIDALAKTKPHVAQVGSMTLLDLGAAK